VRRALRAGRRPHPPTDALDAIWDPTHLERLARTYWRWLSRATGGVVQVDYQEHGRQVKALGLIPLLTFKEPEYEMSADRGIVRWRIERGVLVAKAGRGGAGYLEIDVKRQESKDYPGSSICHVEVEVANFYPRSRARSAAGSTRTPSHASTSS
jgi:hypothetical protein